MKQICYEAQATCYFREPAQSKVPEAGLPSVAQQAGPVRSERSILGKLLNALLLDLTFIEKVTGHTRSSNHKSATRMSQNTGKAVPIHNLISTAPKTNTSPARAASLRSHVSVLLLLVYHTD